MPDIAALFSYPNFLIIPAAAFAIILHEMGHGYAALLLGDSTAKREGRLSLNPIRHIDPIGLICLMVIGFGWAKPVSVDMRYFRNPKQGMALSALAGPAVNIILALISLFLLSLYIASPDLLLQLAIGEVNFMTVLFEFLQMFIIVNIGLGVFNLIPLPPLDGSKIIGALLPDNLYYRMLSVERYGMILLAILLFSGFLNEPLYAMRTNTTAALEAIAFAPARLFGWFEF